VQGLQIATDWLPLPLCDALESTDSLGVISSHGLSPDELHSLRRTLARPQSARRPLHPALPTGERGASLLVASYAGKDQAVQSLGEFAAQNGLSRRAVAALEQAVDELLLNALFDAPCDDRGQPRYLVQSPRERLAIVARPGEEAEVRFAADDRRVVVAVRDPFGALRRSTVLRYFRRCALAQQARQSPLEQKTGGSGVGLFLVLSTASELLFRLHAGHSTDVVYTIYRQRPWPLRALLIEDSDGPHPASEPQGPDPSRR
jgi:anti-sigma regulatory factor (Ser/Thr protein kinase)